nr:hypothetical protein [Clostridia bacterium]
WGQSPDGHNSAGQDYHLPGHSRMTAMEGCTYFGIPNCCRVRIGGHPMPPYDQESLVMDTLDQVVWSLLGAGAEPATEWGDLDEVIRQAKIFPNITGGVFDDFVSPKRLEVYTPEKLSAMKQRMCEGAGRHLDMWMVYYEHNLHNPDLNLLPYLKEFDVISFWTWRGENLKVVDKNLDLVAEQTEGKRMMAGCYMWDYGGRKPLDEGLMQYQLDVYTDYLKRGKIDGIIICSNCIGDLGIKDVYFTRDWIKQNGDTEI